MPAVDSSLGLYLSVPFCRAKCSFCNFASGVGTEDAVQRYVALVCEELRAAAMAAQESQAELPRRVDTIYLGGGTPSLLTAQQLLAIFAVIAESFEVASDAEITLEAAPGQIGDELVEAALRLGINRVSLGVQTFVDREAQAVGRSHTRQSCLEEFARLRRAGVRNLGADLIAGLPYQSPASWESTLQTACDAELDHLSVYMLEIDEDSRLGREVLGGGARLHAPAVASDDLIATLYEQACDSLPSAGFAQYEISNFARQGFESAHNCRYWQRSPYLGVGLDAHSMLRAEGQDIRWANPEELHDYAGARSQRQTTPVTLRQAFEETVFLGLRLVRGVGWAEFRRFPDEWLRALQTKASPLCGEGLMASDGQRLWLEARGRLVSGEIFGELLADVA